VKLVLSESDSEEARESIIGHLEGGYPVHVVDLALSESLNAIWKHARLLKDLGPEEALQAVKDLIRIWDMLGVLTTERFAEEGMSIALAQGITVYDAIYVAAARVLNATLFTADQALDKAAKGIANSRLLVRRA